MRRKTDSGCHHHFRRFQEAGETGRNLERKSCASRRNIHITVLGPNCLRFPFSCTAAECLLRHCLARAGSILLFSKWALLTALLDMSGGRSGITCVSTETKPLSRKRSLEILCCRWGDSVIAFYSEDITDAKKPYRNGQGVAATRGSKPVLVLKSGKTAAGSSLFFRMPGARRQA